jgi:hypothetical protein
VAAVVVTEVMEVVEVVVVGTNSKAFQREWAVDVGDVPGANTSADLAEATFVRAMGTVLTERCIRSPLLGAGIASQLMQRPPVWSTAEHTPPTSAPAGHCRTPRGHTVVAKHYSTRVVLGMRITD